MNKNKIKICFLVSGNGGNLKYFWLAIKKNLIRNVDLYVIADRKCGAIDFAKKQNINNDIIKYNRNLNIYLIEKLEFIRPDIIITNWHKIIDSEIVNEYYGKMINLHYSLLPLFKGLIGIEPIEKALSLNCQYIGATCHIVDEEVDSGKIISQCIVKVENKNKDEIVNLIFRKECLILLNSILLITNNEYNIIEYFDNIKFDFSPSLNFNDDLFDENFWKEVSIL